MKDRHLARFVESGKGIKIVGPDSAADEKSESSRDSRFVETGEGLEIIKPRKKTEDKAILKRKLMVKDTYVFDFKSTRMEDTNGFMIVPKSHITKETINPYYGYEIPGWEEVEYNGRPLDPDKIYYGLRPGDELEKAAPKWPMKPITMGHVDIDADHIPDDKIIGSTGSNVEWNSPFIDIDTTIWRKEAQDAIKSKECTEFSCAYGFEPDFSRPGTFKGQKYDFVMRNIDPNHLALVPEGRVGSEARVADSNITSEKRNQMAKKSFISRDSLKKFGDAFRGSRKKAAKDRKVARDDHANSIEGLETLAESFAEAVNFIEAQKSGKYNPDEVGLKGIDADASAEEVYEHFIGVDRDSVVGEAFMSLINHAESIPIDPKEGVDPDLGDDEDIDEAREEIGEARSDLSKAREDLREDNDDTLEDEDDEHDDDEDTRTNPENSDFASSDEIDDVMEEIGLDPDSEEQKAAFLETVKFLVEELPDEVIGNDEDIDERKPEMAKDSRMKNSGVIDARQFEKSIERKYDEKRKAISKAVAEVRPVVGDADPNMFDSVPAVYKYAMKQKGIPTAGIARDSYCGAFRAFIAQEQKTFESSKKVADALPDDVGGPFRFLKNIKIS